MDVTELIWSSFLRTLRGLPGCDRQHLQLALWAAFFRRFAADPIGCFQMRGCRTDLRVHAVFAAHLLHLFFLASYGPPQWLSPLLRMTSVRNRCVSPLDFLLLI